MKRNLLIYFLLCVAMLLQQSCGYFEEKEVHAEHAATYTCPMHPQIVAEIPGSCPICGMDLVALKVVGEAPEITEDLEFLLQPTNQVVISSIATVKPVMEAMKTEVPMEGVITYDPNRLYTIPARVGGRIEQLYVKYNYQPVSKGQKLMEIYSPELVTAQKELLYLLANAPEDKALIEGAVQRLLFLGATEEQIRRIIQRGEASYTFAIYSPYDGYVVGLNTSPPTTQMGIGGARSRAVGGGAAGMAGMGGGGAATATNTRGTVAPPQEEMQLREGMYLDRGQTVMRVVNTDQLWAEFNIPADYISSVAKGTPVKVSFPQLPGRFIDAQVDFFQPFYDEGENYSKVRVYLPGQENIAMVGQLVRGLALYTTPPSLWLPKEAVLDMGTRSVAFVKEQGVFKPVAVTKGITEGGKTQVLEGLQQSDAVAVNAQFMVDSESFIRVLPE